MIKMIESPCMKCDDPAPGCSSTCGDYAEYRAKRHYSDTLVSMFAKYNAICKHSGDCAECPFNIKHKDCFTIDDQVNLIKIAEYLDNLENT